MNALMIFTIAPVIKYVIIQLEASVVHVEKDLFLEVME